MMKKISIILIYIVGFSLFIFSLAWVSILEEVYYYKKSNQYEYTFDIELITGTKKSITWDGPDNMIFDVNGYSHHGSEAVYSLRGVVSRDALILGGHWVKIRSGIIDYKLIRKTEIK